MLGPNGEEICGTEGGQECFALHRCSYNGSNWKQTFDRVFCPETALDEIKLLKCVRETDENDALRERTGLNFSKMRRLTKFLQ